MIIDCVSDLHGHYPELEGGDFLIVGGDLTANDRRYQYLEFGEWVTNQKYRKKVVIAGNHDNLLAGGRWDFCAPKQYGWDFEYLCDSGAEFEGLKIWGSPWTLTFPGINPHCSAFTGTEEELEAKFRLIPDDTDILVTHGPGYGVLDTINDGVYPKLLGSKALAFRHKNRLAVKLHVFGHIHEAYGSEVLTRDHDGSELVLVNCSHVNEIYEPVNKPIRIEL